MTDAVLRLRCACGWEIEATEEELIEATQEHGRRLHNMLPTREQVLAMVIERDIDADGPTEGARA